MVDVLNEVGQERRHIQHPTELGILLCQGIGVIVSLAAALHIPGQWNEQRRGVTPLDKVPEVQQPRHPAIPIKIRVQIGDVEVEQRRLQ